MRVYCVFADIVIADRNDRGFVSTHIVNKLQGVYTTKQGAQVACIKFKNKGYLDPYYISMSLKGDILDLFIKDQEHEYKKRGLMKANLYFKQDKERMVNCNKEDLKEGKNVYIKFIVTKEKR